MKIFLMGDQAFVELASKHAKYMICIGSKAEVDEASPAQLVDLVQHAMAVSDYNSIDASPKRTH